MQTLQTLKDSVQSAITAYNSFVSENSRFKAGYEIPILELTIESGKERDILIDNLEKAKEKYIAELVKSN